MNFLISLVAVCVLSAALRNPIKKTPWVFYVIAILLDMLMIAQSTLTLPAVLNNAIIHTMMRGNLGVAMFIVVMFIGVFPRDGKLSKWFRPIRAELSIIACILIAGHMVTYLALYAPRFFAGKIGQASVAVSFVIALLLLALVLVLGVTSFRVVKKHMKARVWKKLQNAAYAFYALVFVHLMLMLAPAALKGSESAMISVAIYCIVFIGYMVARVARALADKREKVDLAQTVSDQGFEAID